MKKAFLLTVALVCNWLSASMAQVSADVNMPKNDTFVGRHHRGSPDGDFFYNRSDLGNVNSYTTKDRTSNLNRYLKRHENNNDSSSGRSRSRHQYNPYNWHW